MTFDRPQRIVHPVALGALLKRIDAPPRVRKQEAERDPTYLALVRQCPCLKCGVEPTEAAHVRYSSGLHNKRAGLAAKPADRWSLPLCSGCHRNDPDSQHKVGETAFWNGLGLNPLLICERLYAQRGDLVAMRSVVVKAISERGT